jgi:hypothetical protein
MIRRRKDALCMLDNWGYRHAFTVRTLRVLLNLHTKKLTEADLLNVPILFTSKTKEKLNFSYTCWNEVPLWCFYVVRAVARDYSFEADIKQQTFTFFSSVWSNCGHWVFNMSCIVFPHSLWFWFMPVE